MLFMCVSMQIKLFLLFFYNHNQLSLFFFFFFFKDFSDIFSGSYLFHQDKNSEEEKKKPNKLFRLVISFMSFGNPFSFFYISTMSFHISPFHFILLNNNNKNNIKMKSVFFNEPPRKGRVTSSVLLCRCISFIFLFIFVLCLVWWPHITMSIQTVVTRLFVSPHPAKEEGTTFAWITFCIFSSASSEKTLSLSFFFWEFFLLLDAPGCFHTTTVDGQRGVIYYSYLLLRQFIVL